MTKKQANTEEEIWKEVIGFPGYEVSNHGRVRSFRGKNGKLKSAPSYMSNYCYKNRYHRVTMSDSNHNKRTKTLHRVVLEAFVGLCPVGHEGCHADGNIHNNHIENLRWDTVKNNHIDMIKHGNSLVGEKNHNSKLTNDNIYFIRMNKKKGMGIIMAKLFNVNPETIYLIWSQKTWKHLA